VGVTRLFAIGGAQAIGAMAYGTESVPRVLKIFGPGNPYVQCAKQLVQREGLSIDLPAGPSEVAVYADASAHPAFVAADLLAQAEHGVDSQVMLVCLSPAMSEAVQKEIAVQVDRLPRGQIALRALQNSRTMLVESEEMALAIINAYAPEHLILASDQADRLSLLVSNAGSVFLGHYSPESAGDYATGTNHVLPTAGFARSFSGVSVDSFVKKVSFQHLTRAGLAKIGHAVETMAEAEGLKGHARAVSIRLSTVQSTPDS
jgi:histidinol dehydrogenase